MRENFPKTRTRTRTGLNDLKKKLTSTLTSYHWVKLIKWGNESNFHIFQSNLTSFLEVNSNRDKSFIINTYIKLAGNCGQFDEAMGAYQAAIDNGYTDVVTFNSYVDVMLRYNGELSFEERKSLLNEFINSLETRFENFSFREKKEVDLHGENYTSALINLLYLYYASECSKITVIHGLGSHSNDQSPVLCAFNQFIEMTGCKYFTHKNNRGASTLEIRNQKKPDKDFLINLMLEKLGTTDNPSSKTEYSVVPFSENRNPETSENPNGFFNGNSNQKQFNLNFHAKEWFPKNSWK